MNRMIVFVCGCMGAMVLAFAEEVAVTHEARISLTGAANTLRVSTRAQAEGYPADVAAPIFRFDASQTNDWSIAANGAVTRIPSLVGSRALMAPTTACNWYQWNGASVANPIFVAHAGPQGGPALDFGTVGSCHGLVFDPDASTACAAYPAGSNVLHHIGSVVAVWDASQSGGWLMGGGYDTLGWSIGEKPIWGGGILWHRGDNFVSAARDTLAWWNTIFQSNTAHPIMYGRFREDGCEVAPRTLGFKNGWQVISFTATNTLNQATGLGINDTRPTGAYRSGGMRVAEYLIFDRILTLAEQEKLEAWLGRKWFGRATTGVNGKADIAILRMEQNSNTVGGTKAGQTLTIETTTGDELTVGELQSARGGQSKIVKNGAGKLVLGDASRWGGELVLKGGTLGFARRTVPTDAAALPSGRYLHLDASDVSTLTTSEEDGVEYVSDWANALATTCGGKTFSAQATDSRRPILRRNGLGAGLHTLDFGAFGTAGRVFDFKTSDGATATISSVGTVFAVIDAAGGGGNLFSQGAGLTRGNANAMSDGWLSYRTISMMDAMQYDGLPLIARTAGATWVNGLARASTDGYLVSGWQVAAFRTPGGSFTRMGASSANDASYLGGFRMGEVIVYNRHLADEEIADVTAYLARKWFGRTLAGYRPDATVRAADLQNVTIDGDGVIDVPSDTARIGRLTVKGRLVKTGAGLLEVETLDKQGAIEVSGGEMRTVGALDVIAADKPAADSAVHFDPADATRLDVETRSDAKTYVVRWHDSQWRNSAFSPSTDTQPILMNAECNGLPILNYGSARYQVWDRSLNGVRSAYVIIGFQNGGQGYFLGSSTGNGDAENNLRVDFFRGDGKGGWPYYKSGGPLGTGWNDMVFFGETRTNGVVVDASKTVPTDHYMLLETHTLAGAHASAFALDRGGTPGGPRLGEVILYERVLSEREKVATRNYLMKKWFGAEPQELPDPEPAGPTQVGRLIVAGEQTANCPGTTEATHLVGEGTLVKTGAGTLAIGDASAFTGLVQVAAGTLTFAKPSIDPAVTPGVRAADLALHLDATRQLETELDSAGIVRVKRWADARGETAWAAVPPTEYGAAAHANVAPYALDEKTVVDMPGAEGRLLLFEDATHTRTALEGIRSVFWVLDSRYGGGHLLGGGKDPNPDRAIYAAYRINFHRDGFGTSKAKTALLDSNAQLQVREAEWRIDGTTVAPTSQGLSGDWQQLSMRLQENAAYPTRAEGLAFDGRWLTDHSQYAARHGYQRLAEVLIYTNRVTDAERDAIEAYLAYKWGLKAGVARTLEVSLASGATLNSDASMHLVGGLYGAGIVQGDISAAKLVADVQATDALCVNGTFEIPAGLTVELRNVADWPKGSTGVTVLTATTITGKDRLSSAVFTGVSPDVARRFNLRVRGNALVVRRRAGCLVFIQ